MKRSTQVRKLRWSSRHARCVAMLWAWATLATAPALAGVWTPIGPRGDFGPTDGEVCNGRVSAIQIDANTHMLYIGASSGGVWRTDASSELSPVWQDLGQNLPHPSVGALALHPVLADDILVGTGDYGREFDGEGGFLGGGGMFHTTDAGAHWAQVLPPSMPKPNTVFRILYKGGSPDTVLAATSLGLLRSDHGPDGPWYFAQDGFFCDLAVDPSNANIVYAFVIASSLGTGVFKSTNGGQNWNLSRAVTDKSMVQGAVAVCRHTPGVVVATWEVAVAGGASVLDVIKSSDAGASWRSVKGSLPTPNGQAGSMAVAIAPGDTSQIYLGSTGMWWTLDNGANWVSNSPLPITHHADFNQLYFDPLDDSSLWLCNDGGVYRYRLGDSQSAPFNGDARRGLQISQIYKIDARRNVRFAALQDDGIVGSLDDGVSWKSLHVGFYLDDGSDVALTSSDDVNPAFWFIHGIVSGGFPVVRGDFSGSLVNVLTPPPSATVSGVYYDRFSNRVFTVTSSGTGGSQFNSYPALANSAADGTLESTGPVGVQGITGSYLDGQTFYLWVKNVNVVGPPKSSFNVLVYRRSGPGWNRTQALIGAPRDTLNVTDIAASRQWPGEVWATLNGAPTQAKVFHSTDYGVTWTDISGDLTGLAVGGVNTITVSPFDNNELYVGTGKGGVYRSVGYLADTTRHWEPFQTGLPVVSVTDIRYVVDESHTGTDKLVIGTYGRGMYERSLDRAGPVYADLRNIIPPWLGTLELPWPNLSLGLSNTSSGGRLLLNGALNYSGSLHLNAPVTIGSYGTPAHLGP